MPDKLDFWNRTENELVSLDCQLVKILPLLQSAFSKLAPLKSEPEKLESVRIARSKLMCRSCDSRKNDLIPKTSVNIALFPFTCVGS